MPDAVALTPKVIHLMCGINDTAGNTGPTTPADYKNNITAMAAVVRDHGISLILGSITPAARFSWGRDLPDPRPRVGQLNEWLRTFAVQQAPPSPTITMPSVRQTGRCEAI
ncbi:GDSL-type esterase/lipase family protein [Brevundimonas sp.]|uniref:GDSL-type esterase/lipase family protein n=1 Tax=Brevundimonas sp. TaxID=1871086 RepID=UPI003BAA651B